jgi:hypothetical protein
VGADEVSLDIDATGYDTAAEALFDGNRRAGAAYETLTGLLAGCGAMAGDDATSADFATAYDDSAAEAVAALADLVSSYCSLGVLAGASGNNHRSANASSVYRQPIPAVDKEDMSQRAVEVAAYTPPTALGGDDPDLPELWNLIADHLEGYAWPGADTDQLRSAGNAWNDAAESVDRLAVYTGAASSELAGQRSPEIRDALDTLDELDLTGGDLAAAFRDLGQACDDYAEQVETTRETVRGILRDLAIEVGATIAAGAIGSVFTFGAAAGGSMAAIAARAIIYARRVVNALKALAKLRSLPALERTATTIRRLRTKLAKWAKSKPRDERGAIGRPSRPLHPSQRVLLTKRPKCAGDDWGGRVSDNGKGAVWQRQGATGNADSVRVMDPTDRYSDGYVRFYNEHGQPIGLDGKTNIPGGSKQDGADHTHIPINADGTYPVPAGWNP